MDAGHGSALAIWSRRPRLSRIDRQGKPGDRPATARDPGQACHVPSHRAPGYRSVRAAEKRGRFRRAICSAWGWRARCLHEPELLILDEPASGLDPAGVVEIRELLASLAREKGVTVFMSSHILTEVDRLATRIGIIHEGRLLEELDTEKLGELRSPRLEIQARDLRGCANRADSSRLSR